LVTSTSTWGTATFIGKGGGERINPIGTKTVRALDRYLRIRAGHRDAELDRLWLGRSGAMTSCGIAEAVKRRALEAGIGDVHVHQLRHSAAHYLRLAGADDDAVLRLMGWKDRSMLHRYGASAADERAERFIGGSHRGIGCEDHRSLRGVRRQEAMRAQEPGAQRLLRGDVLWTRRSETRPPS
jgi:site-specific recombinase XerD